MTRTPLMAIRAGLPEHTPEAEPVLIDTDTPGVVRLLLDDGEEITMDRTELLSSLTEAA